MMYYYAKLNKSDGVFLVSFPDFKNVNTYGETKEDALLNAEEALNGSIESDFERGFSLPKPTKFKQKNTFPIKVFPHIEIAYQLKKLRKGKSQVDIARRLGISYQAYQKLENPRKCNPTIKTLEKISNVLGKKLNVAFN
ncbi:MAG: type II toxin-antitoxin system HicB family antitoxin [Fibrobacteria bacterium]|nr:type II toxin-antitoxin system HicB family antitoxin [Fibrobacteria bacterium]